MAKESRKGEKGVMTRCTGRMLGSVMSVVFVCATLFLKWLTFAGKRYTLPLFLKAVQESGGLQEYYSLATKTALKAVPYDSAYAELLPSYYLLYLVAAAALLSLIRIVLLAFRRNPRFLRYTIYGMVLTAFLVLVTFGGYLPDVGLILSVITVGIDCLGGIYLEQRHQIRKEAEMLRREDAEEKEERKRRTYFPGRYDRGFYHIVWRNFVHNRKSYFLFIAGAGGIVTVLHTLLGVQSGLKSSGTGIGTGYDNGMQRILEEILPVAACFAILILALIITHYLRTRMQNYSIFYSLGIRKHTLVLIIGLEYAACVMIALAAGLLLSDGLLILAGKTVFSDIADAGGWSTQGVKTAAAAAGIYAAAVAVSSLVNYHLFGHGSLFQISARKQEAEKIPHRFLLPGIAAGLAATVVSAVRYWLPPETEKFSANVWTLAGSFVLFYFLYARIAAAHAGRAAEHGESLLSILPWRYRFKTNYRFWYLLFAFHLLSGMIYIPEYAAVEASGNTDKLYPYDFVCMSYDEDEDYFADLSGTYAADIHTWPMLRCTTPLGAPYTWEQAAANQYMGVMWPQGQHIAVSETSYRELKKAVGEQADGRLGLKENEIHVVFQQDASIKSHPLEWHIGDKEPRLRIGQPLRSYNFMERETLFPVYHMKSSERSILTGMFQQGRQENIVVLSDEAFNGYFYDGTEKEGPTRLKLIRCSGENYGKVEQELRAFAEKHKNDASWDDRIQPYYARQTALAETEAEHHFKKAACMAVLAVLLMGSFFLFFIKYGLEQEELVRKFGQLKCFGMPQKERRRLLRGEMMKIVWGSYVPAILLSIPFACAVAVKRMYTAVEMGAYLKSLGILLLCYSLLYAAATAALGKYYMRAVLGDGKKRRRQLWGRS